MAYTFTDPIYGNISYQYAGLFNSNYTVGFVDYMLLHNYRVTLGPVFLGLLFMGFLQGVLFLQYTRYLERYLHEQRWTKWLVHGAFCVCLLKWIYVTWFTYDRFVTHFGDWAYLNIYLYQSGIPVSTALASAICQAFYTHRCWQLCHNWLFLFATSITLVGSLAASAVMTWGIASLAETYEVIMTYHPRFVYLEGVIIPVANVHYACGLACDIMITAFTCYYLLAQKSGFSQTDTMISRLARISVESALGPTIIALVTLVLSNKSEESSWYLMTNLALSHVYTASLLYTVNTRQSVTDGLSTATARTNGGKTMGVGGASNWFRLGTVRKTTADKATVANAVRVEVSTMQYTEAFPHDGSDMSKDPDRGDESSLSDSHKLRNI
ncbi:hypothetical protein M422DRAFT_268528 [Sphaerobolus stellatus SS14]|uniref:DUF6534 domain-containing protein n=1 Tax=Sphaerobolus stellatus (strain SS14) TaxID=990650 RepID=A0A0C9UVA9_SPHS4|nr:hypothetical protein M422DRAFT_269326 [Sphaerobolus stellatus SS14]KIJ29960.1 hypothetical protein M422DRAFT_268528 [Sphaerobolus stellatus SS14]